jgi:two-component system NtrC family sensor kinase
MKSQKTGTDVETASFPMRFLYIALAFILIAFLAMGVFVFHFYRGTVTGIVLAAVCIPILFVSWFIFFTAAKRSVAAAKSAEMKTRETYDKMAHLLRERTRKLSAANEELGEEVINRKKAEKALNERVIQLNCLYLISRLMEEPEVSLEKLVREIISILPSAMKYPETACVRIRYKNRVFTSGFFMESQWELSANIVIGGQCRGAVALFYTEKKPDADNGPFRSVERSFLNAVTERLRTYLAKMEGEETRRYMERQLYQSEKMASIGQLAAGIAHEINNPTGFVGSNLGTLAEYHQDIDGLLKAYRHLTADLAEKGVREMLPAPIWEILDRIAGLEKAADIDFILEDINNLISESIEGADRIRKIVLDMKAFAHPGQDTLAEADINQNIESTLNIVWNELKYKAVVVKDYGWLPTVRCFPQQLNQVFMNLLVNAAHAITETGEIRITTRHLNGHLEIAISDTGSGIPEAHLTRIFDPFFTTKEVGKGTGLGLNVAYNIIKKHQGEIRVDSTVGKGTTFTIHLPAIT